MPLSDIFQVNVVTSSPGLTAPGFGKPLIIGAYTKTWAERYREYASTTAVAADFLTTDPEYLMAARLFGQNPRPPKVAIGRGTLPPTQRWAITPTAVNGAVYQLRVGDRTASFTADSTATVAEITAGLSAAVNALAPAWQASHAYAVGDRCSNGGFVYEAITAGTSATAGGPTGTTASITDNTAAWKYVGAAVTASDQATFVRVTVTNAGAWQALEALNVSLLSLVQDHAEPGLAADLNAILLQNSSWYAILYPWGSSACILAIAAWAEAAKKLYIAQTQDTPVIATALAMATDVAKLLKSSSFSWTAPWYHPATDGFLDAGVSGECLPLDPGTETWKFKKPSGVPVTVLTPTQKANLDAKNCNYYYDAGVYITGEGKVASGEWIDVVRGRDALAAEIQTRVVNALTDASVSKIPFTDNGILVVKAATLAACRKFESPKGASLLIDGSSVVTAPKASDVSATDRGNRVLNGISWTAQLQSAIHSGTISGVVTY